MSDEKCYAEKRKHEKERESTTCCMWEKKMRVFLIGHLDGLNITNKVM